MATGQYGVATAASKLDCVQIDGLVVLKIIKHCRWGPLHDLWRGQVPNFVVNAWGEQYPFIDCDFPGALPQAVA